MSDLIASFLNLLKGCQVTVEHMVSNYQENWVERFQTQLIHRLGIPWLFGFGDYLIFFVGGIKEDASIYRLDASDYEDWYASRPESPEEIQKAINKVSGYEEPEEEPEEAEMAPSILTVPSFAGTEQEYLAHSTVAGFRVRNNEDDGTIRIHIAREFLRERPGYVALDVDKEVFNRLIEALSEQD